MAVTACFLAGASSAARAWRYLTPFLPPDTIPVYHDLEGISSPDPASYSWAMELRSLEADLAPVGPTHLVGFSAGATLALAYVAERPERVASLSLVEPAWSFLPLDELEADYYRELDAVIHLPAHEQQRAFRRLLVRGEVDLGEPPAEYADAYLRAEASGRPTGLRMITDAMLVHQVEARSLREFRGHVYLVVGGRSHPMWHSQAESLAQAFPFARIEVFDQRHHLDAPQKSEPARFAAGMLRTWRMSATEAVAASPADSLSPPG